MLPTYHPPIPPPSKATQNKCVHPEILVLLPTLATPLAEMTINATFQVCAQPGGPEVAKSKQL